MPQLGLAPAAKKIYLPSTVNAPEDDKAWVLLNIDIPVAAIGDITKIEGDDLKMIAVALSYAILDWNYTDASGAREPITVDTIRRLGLRDFTFLGRQVDFKSVIDGEESLSTEDKKKSDPLPSRPDGE